MSWPQDLFDELRRECRTTLGKTPRSESDISKARVLPSTDAFTLAGAKTVKAAALFFDLRGFTHRINSDDLSARLEGLAVLNAVIPVVSRIVYGVGGYIEKNTGDGVMAIIGVEQDDRDAVKNSMLAALRIFAALDQVINPELQRLGIAPTGARIGIDYGQLLLARVGLPTGTASMGRNFITAVGATANIACKIQQQAGTNEIWLGDSLKIHAPQAWLQGFHEVSIPNWTWGWMPSGEPYRVWNFVGRFTSDYTKAYTA
jgi:adenylate cyclase